MNKNNDAVFVGENLVVQIWKISYLRKDPMTNVHTLRLNDGANVTITEQEYLEIAQKLSASKPFQNKKYNEK